MQVLATINLRLQLNANSWHDLDALLAHCSEGTKIVSKTPIEYYLSDIHQMFIRCLSDVHQIFIRHLPDIGHPSDINWTFTNCDSINLWQNILQLINVLESWSCKNCCIVKVTFWTVFFFSCALCSMVGLRESRQFNALIDE